MASAIPSVFGGQSRRRRQVGPRPSSPGFDLKTVVKEFAPKFVLPEPQRTKAAISAAGETTRAVERISKEKGVTRQQAQQELLDVARQIEKRDEILRGRGKRGGLETAVALRAAGIPGALLKKQVSEFVTPAGTVRTTRLPGGPARRVLLKPKPKPIPHPTPR